MADPAGVLVIRVVRRLLLPLPLMATLLQA